MQFNGIHWNFAFLQFLFSVFSIASYFWLTSANQNYVPINIIHATILTSSLKSGENSSDFLHYDFTRPPICTITEENSKYSWILIDLGYVVEGISEVRFYGDVYHNKANILLSDIDIITSQMLTKEQIQQLPQLPPTDQTIKCGKTGSVAQYTYGVVVSCNQPISARWLLLRRQGQMNVCHLRLSQNKVKPKCFNSIKTAKEIEKVKRLVKVYRSIRHISKLKCQQNCAVALWNCEGMAFVPMGLGTGICQLLRIRNSVTTKPGFDGLFCDAENSCSFLLNKCQFGKSIYVGSAQSDKVLSLTIAIPASVKSTINITLVSLEISGTISCSHTNCDPVMLYVSQPKSTNKEQRSLIECASISPQLYRVLDKEVFICNPFITTPEDIVIRMSGDEETKFNFKSIKIKIIADPIRYKLFNISNKIVTTLSSTRSTSITTTQTPSTSNQPIIITGSSTSSKVFPNIDLKMSKTNSTKSQYSTKMNSTTSKLSTIQALNKTTTLVSISAAASSSSTSLSPMSKSISSSTLSSTSATKSNLPHSTSSLSSSTSQISSSPSASQSSKSNIIASKSLNSTYSQSLENVNQNDLFYNKNNRSSNNSSSFENVDILFGAKTSALWIILLGFIMIFIIVTFIGLLVSSLQSRNKRKEWELPDGGLCPPNEPINLEHMNQSTTLLKSS